MASSISALGPIFAYFLVGTVLRSTGLANRDHAQFVFRLVFFVTLPALAFGAISGTTLSAKSTALPIAGFLVDLACALVAAAYSRKARLDPAQAGAVVLGAGISNMVFLFPFVLAVLGREALVQAVLYDIGNAVFVATGAYLVASRYGKGVGGSLAASLGRMLRSPLFLAVLAAIFTSVAGWSVPAVLRALVDPIGAATMPLILVALGILFSKAQLRDRVVYATVALRMLVGLVVGVSAVIAFGLTGLAAVVVAAGASAPIGFNSVTLTSIGELDVEHATASLSVSVAVGLVSATTMMLAGSAWLSS